MSGHAFDETKSQAFAARMLRMINDSALGRLIYVGRRVGLFDALGGETAATSETIANKTGLEERYVREWLGGMVVGKIVIYDSTNKTYRLPHEHAAWLGTQADNIDFSGSFEFIHLLGMTTDDIVHCFQNGGGIPYSEYIIFMDLMSKGNRDSRDEIIVTQRLDLVPGIVQKLEEGIKVADIGCGHGYILNKMAEAFPRSTFTGYDFVADYIEAGAAEAKAMGLSNIRFVQQDVTTLGEESAFDFIISVDAIHDQAEPAIVLEKIADALMPDGVFLMVEINASSYLENNIGHPMGPFLYLTSLMHCTPVSLAHGGPGLGAMWGKEAAVEMLQAAGFKTVETTVPEGSMINLYYIARK